MLKKRNRKRGAFTLVEIMIVVAIIALLAAIAVPGFLRARKRSQASRIVNDLRMIDSGDLDHGTGKRAIRARERQTRRLHRWHKRLDPIHEERLQPLCDGR